MAQSQCVCLVEFDVFPETAESYQQDKGNQEELQESFFGGSLGLSWTTIKKYPTTGPRIFVY